MNHVTIIGTGPAGLTAAIYTARAGLSPVIYTGLQNGGQLTTTTEVENFPGFREGIMGPALMENMLEQAKRVGARVVTKQIEKVDFSKRPFKLWEEDAKEPFLSQTVIIATGATAKTLGLPRENVLMGRGVSTCATCDGFFYKNRKVVVVGGGDSAMEEASYLSKLCKEVVLVHRRDVFRASNIMFDRVKKNSVIKTKTPYSINRLLEDATGLTGIELKHEITGQLESFDCDGLFYAIGHRPNSEIFKPWVDTDDNGYIKTLHYTATKTPGVFAAGDIADSVFRQAVTAAGLGCQAALQASRFLEEHE